MLDLAAEMKGGNKLRDLINELMQSVKERPASPQPERADGGRDSDSDEVSATFGSLVGHHNV